MYCVTFEATGYTAHLKHCEQSLDQKQIEMINAEYSDRLNGAKLMSGHITPDDNQDPHDAHIFCVLTFAVNCESESEAENFNLDSSLLMDIGEKIPLPVKNLNNLQPMELENHSWEVSDVEVYEEPSLAIEIPQQQKRLRM